MAGSDSLGEWFSTADRMPPDDTPVLTHRMNSHGQFNSPTDYWVVMSWNVPQWADNEWFDGDEHRCEKEDITSWQFLTVPNAQSACERCSGTQVVASLKRNEEGEPMELPCPEPTHFIAKVAR